MLCKSPFFSCVMSLQLQVSFHFWGLWLQQPPKGCSWIFLYKSIRMDYLRWGFVFSCPVSVGLYGCWEMKLPVVYFVWSFIGCQPYWNVSKATESFPSNKYLFSLILQEYSCSTSDTSLQSIVQGLLLSELLYAYATQTAVLFYICKHVQAGTHLFLAS